jgi:hypothetical protein
MHTGFWWGNLRVRYHLEDTGIDESIILTWIAGSGIGEHSLD